MTWSMAPESKIHVTWSCLLTTQNKGKTLPIMQWALEESVPSWFMWWEPLFEVEGYYCNRFSRVWYYYEVSFKSLVWVSCACLSVFSEVFTSVTILLIVAPCGL